jgi:hypothetical protein
VSDRRVAYNQPRALAGCRVVPASTAKVVELIRRGDYHAMSQVLQFLAAPGTPQRYEVCMLDAQRVADQLGADVYIVGAAGGAVQYDNGLNTFVAVRGGPDRQVVVP